MSSMSLVGRLPGSAFDSCRHSPRCRIFQGHFKVQELTDHHQHKLSSLGKFLNRDQLVKDQFYIDIKATKLDLAIYNCCTTPSMVVIYVRNVTSI